MGENVTSVTRCCSLDLNHVTEEGERRVREMEAGCGGRLGVE